MIARHVLRAGVALLLLALAWGSVSGAIRQLPRELTAGQRLQTWVQLTCGAFSLLVVFTRFAWRSRARAAWVMWAASLAAAAGLSALVWGPPMPLLGLVFAGAALLVAVAVERALR